MPGLRRLLAVVAAAALVVVSLALVHDHAKDDSLSPDEPIHILAGYLGVTAGTSVLNIEHPPATKILAGLAVSRLPLPEVPKPMPRELLADFGHGFALRAGPDRLAAAARAPFLGVLALLLAAVFFVARRRYGDPPALFALALLAFDPNFVAHAGIVHTDVAAALAFFVAAVAWDAAYAKPRPWTLALAGAALGIALATKFSTVYLIPVFAVHGLLAARRDPRPALAVKRLVASLAVVGAVALLVVVAIYVPVTSRMDPREQAAIIHAHVAAGAPGLSRKLEGLTTVSRPLAQYLGGVAAVARQNVEGGGPNFLLGRTSKAGSPAYFPVAFLFKSALGFLGAAIVAAWGLWRDPRSRAEASLTLLTPVVLFLVLAGSSYNIGIRHLLPVYPFLALAAAGVLARLGEGAGGRRRLALALLVGLPLVSAVEVARVHPFELSYFNPLAGGPVGGRRILSDSNVDWGLDLKRLAAELRRRGVDRPTVCYFGGDDVPYRVGVSDFLAEPVLRGRFVAVSAYQETMGPAFYAYHGLPLAARNIQELLDFLAARGRLVGRVGYSIDLFEIPSRSETP
jgi:4-amino-4-deoxy-L-arabinose transferase-like glycosyltransferase